MNPHPLISIDGQKRFGKPCIEGTRIAVADILEWMAQGLSPEAIIADFPELTPAHIQAALAFAADREHRYRIAS